jgi:hypothetical protein
MLKIFIASILTFSILPPIALTASSQQSNRFIDGTYTDNNGSICTLETSELNDGRTEAALSCLKDGKPSLSATWATGQISGHPFELDLKAAGIDKISGYKNYSWGKVGNGNGGLNCFSTSYIMSARQVRKTLSLSSYRNINTVNCGVNLIKK